MRTIETKTARSKLPVSKVPVFVRLGQGVSIGYRRNVGGAGVWIVRIADGKRGNLKKRVALADDLAPADGREIMDYQQAADAARRLGRGEIGETKTDPVLTLKDAVEAYRADLGARQAGTDNVTRLLFNVSPTMLKRPVALLDVAELRKWRDGCTKRMVPASVNRLATIMKAVLNLAAAKVERISTRPWEIGLAALPEATLANNVVLPEATIRRLVLAAREQSPEFGYAGMSKTNAAKWIASKLTNTAYDVSFQTIIDWRKDASNPRNTALNGRYRSLQEASEPHWGNPMPYAETLIAKLVAFTPKKGE